MSNFFFFFLILKINSCYYLSSLLLVLMICWSPIYYYICFPLARRESIVFLTELNFLSTHFSTLHNYIEIIYTSHSPFFHVYAYSYPLIEKKRYTRSTNEEESNFNFNIYVVASLEWSCRVMSVKVYSIQYFHKFVN